MYYHDKPYAHRSDEFDIFAERDKRTILTTVKRFPDRRVLPAIGNSTYPKGPGPLFTSESSAQELAKLLREWGEFELCRGEVHTNVERPRMEELLQATFGRPPMSPPQP
jgi:hypothetical protein